MGRKLEWELSGKSDVPQKMAQAKASMEGVEGAANAVGKKFREAFKDIALGFVAPMVLVQKAIGFITDKIEKAKKDAQDARDFAKEEESKKYTKPGGREAILQWMDRQSEEEKKKKGQDLATQGYEKFLREDPRGTKIYKEEVSKQFKTRIPGVAELPGMESILLQGPGGDAVRKRIDAMLAPDIASRQAAEEAAKAKETKDAAVKTGLPDVGSNVVGVGMSPQLDALNKSVALQEDMANSLRTMIERDQAATGFKTEKFWPSANRPPAR